MKTPYSNLNGGLVHQKKDHKMQTRLGTLLQRILPEGIAHVYLFPLPPTSSNSASVWVCLWTCTKVHTNFLQSAATEPLCEFNVLIVSRHLVSEQQQKKKKEEEHPLQRQRADFSGYNCCRTHFHPLELVNGKLFFYGWKCRAGVRRELSYYFV